MKHPALAITGEARAFFAEKMPEVLKVAHVVSDKEMMELRGKAK